MQKVGTLVVEVGEGAGGWFEAWYGRGGWRMMGILVVLLLLELELVAFGSGEGG